MMLAGSILSGCCVVGRLRPHGTYYQTKVCYCAVSYVKKTEYEHQVQQCELLNWLKTYDPKRFEEYLNQHPEDRYLVD